jgi:hypothetical protein
MTATILKLINPKTFENVLSVNGILFNDEQIDDAISEVRKFDRFIYGEYFKTSSDQTQTYGTLEGALDFIDSLHRH